jgi:hypothetical protein
MGIDIVGWRNCPLQKRLGQDEFLAKLKLKTYRQAAESLAPNKLDDLQIKIRITGRPDRTMTYRSICEELTEVFEGIPECDSCPISSGRKLGCYHYITYPLDKTFERLIFEFFIEQVQIKNSVCDQIYRDVIAKLPDDGSSWRFPPGEASSGSLTPPPETQRHRFDSHIDSDINSAQILTAIFDSLWDTSRIIAYAIFWDEFIQFTKMCGIGPENSRTLAEVLRLGQFFKLVAVGAIVEGGGVIIDP